MFVVRNIRTHEIVEAGFATRAEAEASVVKWVNKDWGHYEAYPEDIA